MTLKSLNLLHKYVIPYLAPDGPGGGGSSPSPSPSAPASSPGPASSSSSEPSGAATSTPSPSPSSASPTSPPGSPPQPSPAPAPEPSGASPGEAFDFAAIFDPQEPAATTVEPTQPAQAPAAPTQPAAQEPPVQPPPTQQPPAQAQPQAPTSQAPGEASRAPDGSTPQAPAQSTPQLDHYDPAALAQHLAQNEAQAIDYAASNVFKFSPEEIEALETNVADTVPKLLAKVFVKSQLNVLSQMASMIPVMIQRHSAAMQRHTENEGKFYSRWTDLKKDQHGALVTKYAAVYRQMHPNATLDEMIETVGPMVMMAAKVTPSPSPPAASSGQAPANPMARAAGQNGRSPPPSPFVPAGAGPASSATVPELDPVSAMFVERD